MAELLLKPCPFCGGEAELITIPRYFSDGSGYIFKCMVGCCIQMPYRSEQKAIEAWNRRAGEDDA